MAEGSFTRPALGYACFLGTLYSAHKDEFLRPNLFKSSLPDAAVEQSGYFGTEVAYTEKSAVKERFDMLDMSAELRASFLAGLIFTRGTGGWLSNINADRRVQESSLIHTVQVSHENVNLSREALREYVDIEALQNEDATHVVCGIRWGERSIITARTPPPEGQGEENAVSLGNDTGTQDTLQQVLRSIGGQGSDSPGDFSWEVQKLASSFEFTIHSDIEGSDGKLDYAGVCKFLGSVPEAIQKSKNGKGFPISYELVPIEEAARKLGREIKPPTIQPLGQASLNKIVRIYETLDNEQDLDHHIQDCEKHAFCVPQGHAKSVLGELERRRSLKPGIQSLLNELIVSVRRGEPESTRLVPRLDETLQSLDGGGILSATAKYKEKMVFADGIPSKATHHLPDDPEAVAKFIRDHPAHNHHILHYNAASIAHPNWKDTRDKFMELALSQDTTDSVAIAVDCDMGEERPLPKPYITCFRDGLRTIPDLVAATRELANKSILRCKIVQNVQRISGSEPPDEQRPVRIACPGLRCSSSDARDWICGRCMEIVHFGVVDEYLYCHCGRYKYFDAEFKCSQSTHGPEFGRFTNKYMLHVMLQRQPPCEEHNILVVGEVGVRNSTFINTFINSIIYDSWSEAREDPELRYAAPCSFSVEQKTDGGEVKTYDVHVGPESDSAAAQTTRTYVFNMNGRFIRLIEAPGIGDPEGITRDCDMMETFLMALRNVKTISTILFLVNPEGDAPSPAIDYWFTEFLSHLHQDAKKNIVFGFTKPPSSGASGAAIRATLAAVLEKRNIRTRNLENPFCFSAAPFRYLAAQKLLGLHTADSTAAEDDWDKTTQQVRHLVNRTVEAREHMVGKSVAVSLARWFSITMTKPASDVGKRLAEFEKAIKKAVGRVSHAEARQPSRTVDEELKKALASLCSFVQHNACVTFNDAVIPYLETLQRERKKDTKILGEQLDKCKLEWRHLEQLFKDHRASPPNRVKLVDVMESTFLLEHVGKGLEDAVREYSQPKGRVTQRARHLALGPSGVTVYEWMENSGPRRKRS